MRITAKVTLSSKVAYGDQFQLSFVPDYQDGRNKEWASATPALGLNMMVIASVAELFGTGGKYTLTFSESTSDDVTTS